MKVQTIIHQKTLQDNRKVANKIPKPKIWRDRPWACFFLLDSSTELVSSVKKTKSKTERRLPKLGIICKLSFSSLAFAFFFWLTRQALLKSPKGQNGPGMVSSNFGFGDFICNFAIVL